MRITIIGAGFSGATLATELATSRDTDLDVCLVGVPTGFGRGVAYGEARPEHLLNVRAGHLGADPRNHDEFAQWLNLSDRARASFLPRVAYGDYLLDRLRTAEALATNLTTLEHEAIELERVRDGFRVHLGDGSQFFSDRVVLALGTLPPQRLAGIGPRLARHPRYVGSPWQEGDLDRIDADARLLIVGTGLTMVDVVSTLHRRGHRGRIDALSRHGLAPQRHLDDAPEPIELPPSVLHALRAGDLHALTAAVRSLVRVVPDWRAVIDALRPHSQGFWRELSTVQRARFLRHLRSAWDAHRHRTAPRTADELDALIASGQLRLRAGRLVRAGIDGERVSVLVRARGADHNDHDHYDGVIRATGFDTDIARTTHPLVQQLVASGLITPDPLGLGLRASDGSEALDAGGAPVPGLYAIGALLRGRDWEITAIPELRAAAASLAQALRLRAPAAGATVRSRAAPVSVRGAWR